MKKTSIVLLLLVAVFAVMLTACGASLTGITVDPSAKVTKGETFTLTPQYTFDREMTENQLAAAVAKQKVEYTTSDEAVATVDAVGIVTAVDGGEATVTAAVGEATATCKVTVVVPVSGVEADKAVELQTNGDAEKSINAKVLPTNATDKKITYTSDNEDVATVDAIGKVTAVGKGTAVITATADGKTAKTDVTVTVKITGISLESAAGWIYVGGSYQIKACTAPVEADATTYTFSSDNTKVATVNGSGVITGKSTGTAKITVSGAGFTQTYTITVKTKPAPVAQKPTTPNKGGSTAGGAASGGAGSASGGGSTGGGGGSQPQPPAVDVSGAISAGIGYGQSLGSRYVPGCGGSCAANLPVDELLSSNICQALAYYASLGNPADMQFDITFDGASVYVWFC